MLTTIRFRRPRRHRLVFVGQTKVELLTQYIAEDDYCIYTGPRSELNLWVLMLAAFRGWWSLGGYYGAFLRVTRPAYVVTGEDNAVEFFLTKRYLADAKTICVQNGRRDSFSSDPTRNLWEIIRHELRNVPAPDLILTHGEPASTLYRDALANDDCRIISVGSVLNNAVAIGEARTPPRLLFVSSFPNLGTDGELATVADSLMGHWGGRAFTYREVYESEGIIAALVSEYAQVLGLEFGVLGKRPASHVGERRFFDSAFNGRPWKYFPCEERGSSYAAVSPNDVLVNMDSTFGYEMLARGLKVAFVAARMSVAGVPEIRDCNFAHPYITAPTGPFWTNLASRDEVFRVLDAVMAKSNGDWCAELGIDMEQICAYDRGNTRLCASLGELGLAHRGPRVIDVNRLA